jgi:hypothetical protein
VSATADRALAMARVDPLTGSGGWTASRSSVGRRERERERESCESCEWSRCYQMTTSVARGQESGEYDERRSTTARVTVKSIRVCK